MLPLRQLLVRNFGLKLLALAISFSLWAVYTAEPFAEVGFSVPIAFANVPRTLALDNETPTMARVVLRGRTGLLQRLSASDLNISIDLGALTARQGDIDLDPAMVRVPFGTQVVRLSPSRFHVALVPSVPTLPQTE